MEIRWLRFMIVLLLVTLLNAGELLEVIAFGSLNIRPDLLLIMLVFISINSCTTDAICASFAIGFAADISGMTMGPYMIAFGLFGSFVSQLQKVVVMRKVTHQAFAILLAGMLTGMPAQLLTCIKTGESVSNFFSMVGGTAAYSALVGPVVWFVLSALSLSEGVRQPPYRRMANR